MQYSNLKFLCECVHNTEDANEISDIMEAVEFDDIGTLKPDEVEDAIKNIQGFIESGCLDENDATFMLGLVAESAVDIFGEDILVTEGKNLQLRAKIKPLKKEYKTLIKGVKKAIKIGDYKVAKVKLSGCKKVIKELGDALENAEEDSFASMICGNILQFTIMMIRTCIIGLLSFPLPIVGMVINGVTLFKDSMEQTFAQIANVLQNQKIGYSDLNSYKLATKALIQNMEKTVDNFDKILSDAVNMKDINDTPDPTTTQKAIDMKEDLTTSLSHLTSATKGKKK